MTAGLVSIVLLFGVAPPPLLLSDTESVRDHVGLFSPRARQEAQQRIDEIREQYKVTLSFETIETIPGVSPAEFRKMSNRRRRELLSRTARQRAERAGGDGLFVLIFKNPRHVTVLGWPAKWEQRISSVQRERIQKYLASELGSDPDRALIGSCSLFRDIVESNQIPPAAPLALVPAVIIVGSLLGLWVVLRVIRSRVVCPALPIYQPAMLGSLFGVPAGYWIIDRLFRAERPVAAAPLAPRQATSDLFIAKPFGEESIPGHAEPEHNGGDQI